MPKLIAFIPHPDDESYSFSGTLALLAKAGWECHIHCASYGERGKRHDGGPATPNAIAELREAELEASCAVLGARPPEFWGLPDGEMRLHRGEQRRITGLISDLRPELLLTLGADGAYGHPDHIALHRWVLEAWLAGAEPRPPLLFPAFPKGLFLPQYEKCLGMMGDPPEPPPDAIGAAIAHYELAIAEVADLKLASVAAHRSQLPGGDPHAIFPPGILASLLELERMEDASEHKQPQIAELLTRLR